MVPTSLPGQGKEGPVYLKRQKVNWGTFVKNTEKENNIRIFYDPEGFPDVQIEIKNDSTLLDEALKDVFGGYGLALSTDNSGNYFLFKGFSLKGPVGDLFFRPLVQAQSEEGEAIVDQDSPTPDGEYLKTYGDFINERIVIGSAKNGKKKEKVLLSGVVTNSGDKSPIQQALLKIAEAGKTAITDVSGNYNIQLEPGTYTLTVSSLGMFERNYRLTLLSDGKLNIALKTKSFLLEEAEVLANRNNNVTSTTMGFERITEKAIKELPAILGEKDVVKTVLLLPGVQSVGEISSGFNVRGSPADQNMFYINDLPVYNSSHLFGLFTTFNSDAISEFNFYKNNIPIEYGGQLSSIFDIDVKKGNNKYFSTRGGIGPTSARVLVEGPIKKENSSYLVSVRSTYSDWLLKQVDDLDVKNSAASFNDALLDFSLNLNKNNNLDLFFYGSSDYADLSFGIKNDYSNLGAAIKWTHLFNKNLTGELALVKSRYAYKEENSEIGYLSNKHSFGLNHTELKAGLKYDLKQKHSFRLGLDVKYYKLDFGDFLPLSDESNVQPVTFEPEQALNASVFLGDTWDVSARLAIEGGVRASYYAYLGPKTIYQYEKNTPKEPGTITGSDFYGKNELVKTYQNLDYRISAKYELPGNSSVKAGYNLIHQYIFMLSNTISVSPISKWKLSDPHLKPMGGGQYSLGYYKNFPQKQIETSVEVYYKSVENLVEYKDGAEFITNQYPEANIIQGDLEAYGIEWMAKKKEGKLNGWINYTLSKSEVRAFNPVTGEKNNQGLAYPANYDRPHAVNLALNYRVTKRLSFSVNMVYSTGRPITVPTAIYYLNDIEVTAFSKRNEYRLPDYFRTDLSINIEGNLKKNKLAHSSWSLSFYNLTARKNPYSMVFQNVNGEIKGYKISILGTMIPSINYNLKFGNYEN